MSPITLRRYPVILFHNRNTSVSFTRITQRYTSHVPRGIASHWVVWRLDEDAVAADGLVAYHTVPVQASSLHQIGNTRPMSTLMPTDAIIGLHLQNPFLLAILDSLPIALMVYEVVSDTDFRRGGRVEQVRDPRIREIRLGGDDPWRRSQRRVLRR